VYDCFKEHKKCSSLFTMIRSAGLSRNDLDVCRCTCLESILTAEFAV
jgi:hypothetical protein